MTDLELMICESCNYGEISIETRDKMLNVIKESANLNEEPSNMKVMKQMCGLIASKMKNGRHTDASKALLDKVCEVYGSNAPKSWDYADFRDFRTISEVMDDIKEYKSHTPKAKESADKVKEIDDQISDLKAERDSKMNATSDKNEKSKIAKEYDVKIRKCLSIKDSRKVIDKIRQHKVDEDNTFNSKYKSNDNIFGKDRKLAVLSAQLREAQKHAAKMKSNSKK